MEVHSLSAVERVMPSEALQTILTAALAGALPTFGILERRALRDG